jgi:hypothetical protein
VFTRTLRRTSRFSDGVVVKASLVRSVIVRAVSHHHHHEVLTVSIKKHVLRVWCVHVLYVFFSKGFGSSIDRLCRCRLTLASLRQLFSQHFLAGVIFGPPAGAF